MNATKTSEGNRPVCPGVLNNGQTVAMIGTTLTVAVGIAAMIFASTSAIRVELRTEIRRVDATIAQMRKELSADIKGLDGRLRVVEQTLAAVNARLTPSVEALPDPTDLAHGAAQGSGG